MPSARSRALQAELISTERSYLLHLVTLATVFAQASDPDGGSSLDAPVALARAALSQVAAPLPSQTAVLRSSLPAAAQPHTMARAPRPTSAPHGSSPGSAGSGGVEAAFVARGRPVWRRGCSGGPSRTAPQLASVRGLLPVGRTSTYALLSAPSHPTSMGSSLSSSASPPLPSSLLTRSEHAALFGGLGALLRLHASLLPSLAAAGACVGDVLRLVAPSIAVAYEPFVAARAGVGDGWALEALSRSPAWAAWLRCVEARPAAGRQSLGSLLAMPLQRVPRMALILRELVAAGHAEAARAPPARPPPPAEAAAAAAATGALMEALALLRAAASRLDEVAGEAAARQQLQLQLQAAATAAAAGGAGGGATAAPLALRCLARIGALAAPGAPLACGLSCVPPASAAAWEAPPLAAGPAALRLGAQRGGCQRAASNPDSCFPASPPLKGTSCPSSPLEGTSSPSSPPSQATSSPPLTATTEAQPRPRSLEALAAHCELCGGVFGMTRRGRACRGGCCRTLCGECARGEGGMCRHCLGASPASV